MTRILVMSETLPLSLVKAHLSELVDRVEDQHDRVVVTRNGKPAAVLISPDDLEWKSASSCTRSSGPGVCVSPIVTRPPTRPVSWSSSARASRAGDEQVPCVRHVDAARRAVHGWQATPARAPPAAQHDKKALRARYADA